jgi:hypothetical protein
MTFQMTFTPPPRTPSGSGPTDGVAITGHGTTNLDPFAMVAFTNAAGIGAVTTTMGGSKVWELGGGQYGATQGSDAAGSIVGFAPLVEGTLGPEEGAVAMTSLGSAAGYGDLVQQGITTADTRGAGTLDGPAVTSYEIFVDPTKLLTTPTTIAGACQVPSG